MCNLSSCHAYASDTRTRGQPGTRSHTSLHSCIWVLYNCTSISVRPPSRVSGKTEDTRRARCRNTMMGPRAVLVATFMIAACLAHTTDPDQDAIVPEADAVWPMDLVQEAPHGSNQPASRLTLTYPYTRRVSAAHLPARPLRSWERVRQQEIPG